MVSRAIVPSVLFYCGFCSLKIEVCGGPSYSIQQGYAFPSQHGMMFHNNQGIPVCSASSVTGSYSQTAVKQFPYLAGGGSSSNIPADLNSQSFQPLVNLPSAPMSFASSSPITSAMNGGAWCPDSDSFPSLGNHGIVADTKLHQQCFPLLVSQPVPFSTSSVVPMNLQESNTSLTCESPSGGLPMSPHIVNSQQNNVDSFLERSLEPEPVLCSDAEDINGALAESRPALGGFLELQPVESQLVSPHVVTTQHNVVDYVLERSSESELVICPDVENIDGAFVDEQSESSQQSIHVQHESSRLESVAEQSKSSRQAVMVPTISNDLNVHSMVTRSSSKQ
ncbi:hypothetical protein V6N13_083558 [Hibiscus sabdariffa]